MGALDGYDAGNVSTIHPIEFSDYDDANFQAPTTNKKLALTTLVFFELLKRVRQQYPQVSIHLVRLDSRQKFDYLSTMPRIVDEDGELHSACVMSFQATDDRPKSFTKNRHISIARIINAYNNIYILIPEVLESANQLELHAILDGSKSIRSTQDLMAAIGIHFSQYTETGHVYDLGHGTISIIYKTEIQHLEKCEDLIADIFHSDINGILAQTFEVSSEHKQS